MLSVADWWIGIADAALGVVAAAAAPATTKDSTRIRMASFIIGNPLQIQI
jgi:hypothetical protein